MRLLNPTPTEFVIAWAALTLRFDYHVDRWWHSLCRADGLVLCSSREGSVDEPQPPSPAYQQLRWECLDPAPSTDGDMFNVGEFQLFGQCGRQAYSAAIRCTEKQIDFDLSMRVQGVDPVSAIATYFASSVQRREDALWIDDSIRIEPVSIRSEPATICVFDDVDQIRIESTNVGEKSKTIRWAYRLSWE